MSGLAGIQSYSAVAGTTAATTALQGTMNVISSAMTAAVDATLPPGSEGASLLATMNNKTNANDYHAKFSLGVTELQKRNGVVTRHSLSTASADDAAAAAVNGVSTAV
jgi:hypothetical protein